VGERIAEEEEMDEGRLTIHAGRDALYWYHYHMVIFPKKDIKNLSDATVADQPYVMDCLGVIRALIVENAYADIASTRTVHLSRTSPPAFSPRSTVGT